MTYLKLCSIVVACALITGCEDTLDDGTVVEISNIASVEKVYPNCVYPDGFPELGTVVMFNRNIGNVSYEFFGDEKFSCDARTFNPKHFLRKLYYKTE